MANTYVLITSNTLSSNSFVTLSSIPQTYTDLLLLCSFKSSHTGGGGSVSITVGFNNDTTLANYSWRYLQSYSASGIDTNFGTGYSWGASGTRATAMLPSSYTSTSTNIFGNSLIYIPNYTSSNSKSFYADGVSEDNAGSSTSVNGISMNACKWTGTAAITRIDIGLEVGNFVNPSTVYLYGIKNS